MLKNLNFLLLTGLFSTLLMGCKKGENDPFLSLKSRKARIAGQWEMINWESSVTQSNSNPVSSSSTTYSYTDEKLTTVYVSGSNTIKTANRYAVKYEFRKNGRFSILIEDYYEEGTIKSEQNIAGTWFFNGKNKSLEQKKKEYISLNIISNKSNSYYSNGTPLGTNINVKFGLSGLETIQLNRLTNNEMVLTLDQILSTQSGSGNNLNISSNTTIGTQTFIKK
jgi:hypothetical protein